MLTGWPVLEYLNKCFIIFTEEEDQWVDHSEKTGGSNRPLGLICDRLWFADVWKAQWK